MHCGYNWNWNILKPENSKYHVNTWILLKFESKFPLIPRFCTRHETTKRSIVTNAEDRPFTSSPWSFQQSLSLPHPQTFVLQVEISRWKWKFWPVKTSLNVRWPTSLCAATFHLQAANSKPTASWRSGLMSQIKLCFRHVAAGPNIPCLCATLLRVFVGNPGF